MTREQLEKHWDVIVAFKEGKTIQCRNLKLPGDTWEDIPSPIFSLDYEYRVKPEVVKPKIVEMSCYDLQFQGEYVQLTPEVREALSRAGITC